jgi:hypothetical protein
MSAPFSDARRFLNYRLARKANGKSDKIPNDIVTDRDINAHDERNWRTYAQVAKLGPVSRVIAEPEIGLDFDTELLVKTYFAQLPPTYCEFSPNRDDEHPYKMHAWYVVSSGHDKLPSAATKNFEVYSRRRHLTLTFNRVPGTPGEITCITFDDAMRIFTLAGYEPGAEYSGDGEPGWWSLASLTAVLKEMSESIPDFEFAPYGDDSLMVTCPGDEGWDDGQKHSAKSGLSRDAIVWIENGWPAFCCLHAHCQDPKKTFRDLLNHYGVDPESEWDRWAESGITGEPIV